MENSQTFSVPQENKNTVVLHRSMTHFYCYQVYQNLTSMDLSLSPSTLPRIPSCFPFSCHVLTITVHTSTHNQSQPLLPLCPLFWSLSSPGLKNNKAVLKAFTIQHGTIMTV